MDMGRHTTMVTTGRLRSVHTVTTTIILTRARLMATTDLIGLLVACSSELVRGFGADFTGIADFMGEDSAAVADFTVAASIADTMAAVDLSDTAATILAEADLAEVAEAWDL